MTNLPLLAAKLFPPPHRPNLVARPRLAQKFLQGVQDGHAVTLVSAPAGFGKTTLVVDWLSDQAAPARPYAWLSLEPADNDPQTFLRYLLAALQTIHPGLEEALPVLAANGKLPPLLPLLNALHEIRAPFYLVLDDYHVIQDPEIHELTAALLDRPPAALHTIITTRQDPLLPLARWRARGKLTEFRLSELRFRSEETAQFFQTTMRLPLSAAQLQALDTRTEGWIAGLQMAAISLQQMEQNGASAAEFIQQFTGDDRLIMDYLIDEVISSQPAPVQEFLFHTAVLDRFNAELCAAILEQPHSAAAAQIDYLDRANLFLIPLDNRRQWFRYHHLFAELLRYRLAAAYGSATVARLRQRAAQWCAQNEMPEQAIGYAQEAGDAALVTRLVRQYAPDFLRQGAFGQIARWMRLLPDQALRDDPWLARDFGEALSHTSQIQAAVQYLQLAELGFAGDPANLGRTLLQSAHNALMTGQFSQQIELALRSLALLPSDELAVRASASLYLGLGYLHSGDPFQAESALRQAVALGQAAGTPRSTIGALAQIGRVCVLRLDFAQAEIYFRRATEYRLDGQPYPGSDLPFFDLAMLFYLQNRLDEAQTALQDGLAANRRSGSAEMLAYAWRLSARLHQLAGRAADAASDCEKALQLSASFDLSPLTLSLNAALQVEMALSDGDLPAAARAAPRVTNSLGVYPLMAYPEMMRVRLLLLQERPAEALALLQPMLEMAARPGWEFPRLQARLLQALAAPTPSAAQPLLEEALALARPASAARPFLDLGAPLQRLLARIAAALPQPELRAYAAELLAHAAPVPAAGLVTNEPKAPTQPLIEALSERELEVLRLIAGGLSNAQIAGRLVLSPNTLKAHTQNIYTKLDVHSRVQAVNRARELGLIENDAPINPPINPFVR